MKETIAQLRKDGAGRIAEVGSTEDPEKIRVSDIYADAVAFQEREFGVPGIVRDEGAHSHDSRSLYRVQAPNE